MKKLAITFLFLSVNIFLAQSALNITYYNLDLSNPPHGYVEIDVKQNNVFINDLSKDNVLIIEGTRSRKPETVEKINNTRYAIRWITPFEEYPQYIHSQKPDEVHLITLSLIVSYNGEAARINIPYENPGLPFLVIKDAHSGNVRKELSFQNTVKNQIYVVGFINKNTIKERIKLDSITFTSPYFSYNWQGNTFDLTSRPPMELEYSTHYLVDVNFNPPDDRPIRALMQFHYNNGMVKSIPLIGGRIQVKQTTMLQLLQPNGGEKLTPCETYEIKWKGHSKDQPVIVEYTYDGGRSWNQIARVMDSVYKWTVPNIESSAALIRVRQEFTKANEIELKEDWSNITKIAFNSNGSKAIGANTQGKIYEFDIYNQPNSPINRYFLNLSGGFYYNLGVDYIQNDNEIAYFYKENIFSSPKVSFFKVGVSTSYNTVNLNFDINKVYTDPKRRFFVAKNAFEPKFYILDIKNAIILNSITTKMPIIALSFNKSGDSLVAIEIDGRVTIYRIQSFDKLEKINEFVINNIAIPSNIKFSPNGQFIAVSVVQEDNTGTDTYLYDLKQNSIVKTYRPAVNEPIEVDFSPSTSAIVIGSPNLDQIVMYDLTGADTKTVISGHKNTMNDMKLDPEGFAILSSSSGEGNLKHRSFSYPELDASDSYFSIISANLSIAQPTIQPIIIGTNNPINLTSSLCNKSEVPIYVYDIITKNGNHLKILNTKKTDTLYPNECFDVVLDLNPKDTGIIQDEIIIKSCYKDFILPIKYKSLDRKLTIINPNGNNFGDICINTKTINKYPIFRNDDTVNVLINKIEVQNEYTQIFKIEDFVIDTIIKPGEILYVNISFEPKELREYNAQIIIYHSNQSRVVKYATLKGKGIGTFIATSHDKLMFINEIDTRIITLKNNSEQSIVITAAIFEPEEFYALENTLPVTIDKEKEITLTIKRLNFSENPVHLRFLAEPCLVANEIIIDNYLGSSLIEIMNTEADPRKNAKIIIKFNNIENYPYKGERFFEGEFTINPRIFLPQTISTSYGTAKIISNNIFNNKRHIKFRIDGDFNTTSGVLCEIDGLAGLADATISPIEWVEAPLWGKSIQSMVKNGEFRLINVCENRLISTNSTSIKEIRPIPASDVIYVAIESQKNTSGFIQIVDMFGKILMKTEELSLSQGLNSIALNVSPLINGTYRLVLNTSQNIVSEKIIIVR